MIDYKKGDKIISLDGKISGTSGEVNGETVFVIDMIGEELSQGQLPYYMAESFKKAE